MATRRPVPDHRPTEDGEHGTSQDKPSPPQTTYRPSLQLTSMTVVVVFCSIALIAFLAGLTTGPVFWGDPEPQYSHPWPQNRHKTGSWDSRRIQSHYQRKDILVAMISSSDRLALVQSSRKWRKGMQTFIALERPFEELQHDELPRGFKEGVAEHDETFGVFEDLNVDDPRWHKAGDIRAVMTPFMANKSIGTDNFKFVLYGDDDTVFFPDNILDLVNGLDHEMPYFMTDCIWFPEKEDDRDIFVHADRKAPRCLPCGYEDPLMHRPWDTTVPQPSWNATPACPCTQQSLCDMDNLNMFTDCNWNYWRPGFWYFIHGGAGAIMSQGLFRRGEYEDIQHYVRSKGYYGSGDSTITETIQVLLGILPTDPGYGYFRPHIQSFDPGWKGAQVKGIEDEDTRDMGNDPMGVIDRLERAIEGWCGEECEDELAHIMTVHIRNRYAKDDVDKKRMAADKALKHVPKEHRPAVHLHHRLSDLWQRYAQLRTHNASLAAGSASLRSSVPSTLASMFR
ncbi:hypothetical protein WJX74_003187 [Apatococcus lobatus]|uniref:Hexosyltransferase n=1 Tax=Apatococcus lobatus TaxID=904363 RepID=A0AAW1RWD1_9CHLO